uniref:Protein kinase domain-containing protein n=1 Tax=Arcella intermedia TaxID=1963864 RepID=A0A6B2L9D5_9EUKA
MDADGYHIVEQIGDGMNSNKVYKAECKDGSGCVAIKQIDLSQQSKTTKDKISREVQGMSVVSESEFVVNFLCSFVFENTLWIVMDLNEGSLCDVLKWKYPLGINDENVICSILHQTLRGVAFLHERNIIHRDIKAGNILFNREGKIRIADFGVSAILSTNDEKRTTMAGTWHWMAPEVFYPEDCGYDFKADVWSVGITCIELAYGTAPYSKARPNQVIVYITKNPPPNLDNHCVPDATAKKFSTPFKDLVEKCLQMDPDKRPTAAKLLNNKFFKHTLKSNSYDGLKGALLEGLPPIGERFRSQQQSRKEKLKIKLAAEDVVDKKPRKKS